MAILQSTTISGSNANTGSLQVTGSTVIFPIIESSLTGSFSGSGKMWINADTQNLQYSINTSLGTVNSPARFLGAWSVGGNLITERMIAASGPIGTQNAGLLAGGYKAPGHRTETEHYDGTSWTAGGALIISTSNRGGAGLDDAALAFAGTPSRTDTEEYNGSTWASGGAMIAGRRNVGGAGFQNAAIGAGGNINSYCTCTEEYNGASWAAGGALPIAAQQIALVGGQNAALGQTGFGTQCCTFAYDGTSWSDQNRLIFDMCGSNGAGTQNAAVQMGTRRSPVAVGCSTEWNGLTWIAATSLINPRASAGVSGNSAGALLSGGGYTPSQVKCTEEYTKNFIPPYTTSTFSKGAPVTGVTRRNAGGAGEQNAAIVMGGRTPSNLSATEEFDGSNWSTGGSLITARHDAAGAGSQNATLLTGGSGGTTSNEEYNGSSWSSANAIPAARYSNATAGTQNAAIIATGYNGSGNLSTSAEYDGTNWSAGGDVTQARRQLNGTGTQNATIIGGGYNSPSCTNTSCIENYDGTSFSAGTAMITTRNNASFSGTQDCVLAISGKNPYAQYTTELWNGSAWSVDNPVLIPRQDSGFTGNGTANAGAIFTGEDKDDNLLADTELFSAVCSTTLCSTLPVWSGAAAVITARGRSFNTGTQAAALVIGGLTPSLSNNAEEYNGTSWTAGGTLITARSSGAATGTQNAALGIAGYVGGSPDYTNKSEEYNGSSFTEGGTLIQGRRNLAAAGTQNAGLAFGGRTPSAVSCTEEYDGTSFTAGGTLISAKDNNMGFGTTQDAAVSTVESSTEEYNGSSWATGGTSTCVGAWSIGGSMITARGYLGGAGTSQNAALAFGGMTPSVQSVTEEYNGSAWSAGGALATARKAIGNAGSQNAGLGFAGYTPTNVTCTEEYSGLWAGGGAMITGRFGLGGAGTQNAAVGFGGYTSSDVTCTEEYDGSTWSSSGALIQARRYLEGDNYSIINCCGDFQIAHKDVWNEIRGFEEELIYVLYSDTNVQKKALMHGFELKAIYSPALFHIYHGKGGGGFLDGINRKTNDPYRAIMGQEKTQNSDTWGFGPIEMEYELL